MYSVDGIIVDMVATREVKTIVKAWMVTKAASRLLRERVNAVYKEILAEIPVHADTHGRSERIYDVQELYKCSDDELCQDIYYEGNKRLRARGIKLPECPDDICPALAAESALVDIENILIKESGKPLGLKARQLYGENRRKYIDLVVGLIVSLPDFKDPKP